MVPYMTMLCVKIIKRLVKCMTLNWSEIATLANLCLGIANFNCDSATPQRD